MVRLLTAALLLTSSLGPLAGSPGQGPIPPIPQRATNRTTATTCGLYEQASIQSPMLTVVASGTLIQVLDSTYNAHFIRAQLSKNGKTLTGYMYRACLPAAR